VHVAEGHVANAVQPILFPHQQTNKLDRASFFSAESVCVVVVCACVCVLFAAISNMFHSQERKNNIKRHLQPWYVRTVCFVCP
jgi:hypothetical protein